MGLKNIVWIKSWVEDIRFLGLGIFHQVQSSGVLHHLKDPLIHTLFSWLQNAGMYFVEFDSIRNKYGLKFQHQSYLDAIMTKKMANMTATTQLSITEILKGSFKKQEFYASKIENSVADLYDSANVLHLFGNPLGFRPAISNKENIQLYKNETIFSAGIT